MCVHAGLDPGRARHKRNGQGSNFGALAQCTERGSTRTDVHLTTTLKAGKRASRVGRYDNSCCGGMAAQQRG